MIPLRFFISRGTPLRARLVPEPVRAAKRGRAGWAFQIMNAFFPAIKQNHHFMFLPPAGSSFDEPAAAKKRDNL